MRIKKRKKSMKKARIPVTLNDNSMRAMKVVKKITEQGGKMGTIMLEAGYSKEYADNPQKLMRTKTFQELLKEAIPDELVTKQHKALINAGVKTTTRNGVTTSRIDSEAISKGLDMLYKLRGAYAPEKSVVLNLYADKDDGQIKEEIDRLERELALSRDPNPFIVEGEEVSN